MIDLRPIGYVLGLLVAALGVAMIPPMLVDIAEGRGEWAVFLESAIISLFVGSLTALACRDTRNDGLTIQQAFILTTATWAVLPLFGAIPFMFGATEARFVDAYFEAISGLTTTGSTVFSGLDDLPKGILLWRGILQWLGGLGIVIVAMLFLPIMRVGGMQYFKSEGFDTLGKVLPRALDIAQGLLNVYVGLTLIAVIVYMALGMSGFDATVHAFTSVSTGGFSTTDASFAGFSHPQQYAGVVFMFLASIPFVRLILLSQGQLRPLLHDIQARTYLRWIIYAVAISATWRSFEEGGFSEEIFRNTLFNTVSIMSGTGYGDGDVTLWGAMPLAVLILVGAIGGCTGSTGCSIKIFRYLVMIEALKTQLKRVRNPSIVVTPRLDGQVLTEDVIGSVIVMFTAFVLGFGFLSVALSLTGLPFMESLTGAWTSIFNIGPAFGSNVASSGSLENFPDAAKWLMAMGMLLGRLELVSVLVLFRPVFWRG